MHNPKVVHTLDHVGYDKCAADQDRGMREVPATAANQAGVFTSAQAGANGWSPDALAHAVKTGRLIRLRRGAYTLAAAEPDRGAAHADQRVQSLQRAAALCVTVPAAVLSHRSAALAHCLPLLTLPERACLTLPPSVGTQQHGMHLHRRRLAESAIHFRGALPITTVARTCLDIACEKGLTEAIVVTDAALHAGLITPQVLRAGYQEIARTRGATQARRLCELANARSESPLESISRLTLHSIGEQPTPQTSIYTESGIFLARVDFYWPELGVVGEADGRGKYDGLSTEPLWREKRRQDALTAHGMVVVRWSWHEATDPGRLRAVLMPAFAQAKLLRSAGLRPQCRFVF